VLRLRFAFATSPVAFISLMQRLGALMTNDIEILIVYWRLKVFRNRLKLSIARKRRAFRQRSALADRQI
jgi:hypothetical protein